MACKYDDESKRKYSEPAKPAQSAPSAEQFLELDKRLQVDMKSEGDEYAPARWDVVYCHPEHRQNVRFRNDNDAATQRVQVRGMISMYADAYAALRTAQLEGEKAHYKYILERATKRMGEIGCDLHNYDSIPEGCDSNIQWRNTRAETAESALAQARERTIQECASIADERAKQNRVHALKFTALDQKNMYERALANAGEAERISERIRALLMGASGAARKGEEK